MILFTKESMDEDKPVPVINILPVNFTGGPINQGITGNTKVTRDQEISVSVITMVVVPVEEDFYGIIIKYRKVSICMECDGKASWVRLQG